MEKTFVLVETLDHYALVTINRPDKLNALNRDTLEALQAAMQQLQEDPAIRAVVLTGAGEKAFVAGADITQFSELDSASGRDFARHGQKIFRYIETMTKPVIAAVNGFALGGGCELAMACHLRLASSKAKFGQPEINLGIIPGYGGTQRLSRLIGLSNALHWTLTGDMIDASRALNMGLVSEIAEPEALLDRAKALAAQLAGKAPRAVQFILAATYRGSDVDLETALELEAEYFGKACATEDMREGTAAFLEKRKPNFKGK